MDATAFALALFATTLGIAVPLYASRARGRTYAVASAVIMGLSFPACLLTALHLRAAFPEWAGAIDGVWAYGFAAGAGHLASLVRARLRPRWFRAAISIPGMTWIAAGVFSLVAHAALAPVRVGAWALSRPLPSWWIFLELVPFAVALGSLPTSLFLRREIVRISLPEPRAQDPPSPATLVRVPVRRRRARAVDSAERPLRVVQITDPHLGPWQPIHLLKTRVQQLLAHDPDLVLLTGDFLTMESRGSPGSLAEALSPLQARPGCCFAVFGNHDHEAPEEVRAGLASNGITLLVDEEARVDTEAGAVQLIGSDWVRRDPGAHLEGLLARHPRRADHLRVLLLHDPVGFPALPDGEVDLTLSGHTHGGQVGLVCLGLDWTVLTRTRWPDHGLFGFGSNRLYVHRGTGHYGFPLRVGVPGEASLLEVVSPQS